MKKKLPPQKLTHAQQMKVIRKVMADYHGTLAKLEDDRKPKGKVVRNDRPGTGLEGLDYIPFKAKKKK